MAKCSECGFLTIRENLGGDLIEVTEDYRISGRVPDYLDTTGVSNFPICFAMAWNLHPESARAATDQILSKTDDFGERVLGVITRDRKCPPEDKDVGFTKYQQGFTPKEHREMLDRERLLQFEENRQSADVAFRREEAEAVRQWQAEEAEKNRIFQQQTMASRTRKDILVFGFFVTLFIVLATIAGAFIERGFWWEDRTPIIEVTMPSTVDRSGSQTESTSEQSP